MFRKQQILKNLTNITKKGYKMTQLHFYTGAGGATPSGIKVSIFGATASIGSNMAGFFTTRGCPTVMVHRNALDVTCPTGDDVMFSKSNPYGTYDQSYLNYETINYSWSELGMRYFQLVSDLTNEWDVEMGIKDADVVINLIGNKKVINYDENYDEPNIWIPREIAKACARKRHNNVKRLIHFSACGASPDAISRRLRTKWLGEQEVMKYFPEATIIRPTTMFGNSNADNFFAHYMHNWSSNNGHVYMVEGGNCLRQPVLDYDVCLAVHNAMQLEESKGSIYELGGPHNYKIKELMEFLSNILNHRPKYINLSYDDCMKIVLGPNAYFEKSFNWLMMRPDYLAECRIDITAKKREGIKTFEDLHIMPLSAQHYISDYAQWMVQRLGIDHESVQDLDEKDANDDAN